MPFPLFLALKYLKPRRAYFSVITLISLLGVLLGVALLIIVLSVMTGFDDMWKEKILGFNAHITVGGSEVLHQPMELADRIAKVPGVRAAAPYIQGPVMIRHAGALYTPILRGVDPERERGVSAVPSHLVAGTFPRHRGEVAVGQELAMRMNLRIGERLTVHSPSAFLSGEEIRLPEELEVSGIFYVGMWDFDMHFLFTTLETARDVHGLRDGAHAIHVMTEDPQRAWAVAGRIREALEWRYPVETWMEQNQQLFGALRVEKNMMFFLLIFIAIVAAFGITNTLITLAVQKTREIGLLKAIGFSNLQVTGVFFVIGFLQGLAGTVAGILFGLAVLSRRNEILEVMSTLFRMDLLPKELYRLSEIPSRTTVGDVVIVATLVVLICTMAGILPAGRAARLDPVEALRNE